LLGIDAGVTTALSSKTIAGKVRGLLRGRLCTLHGLRTQRDSHHERHDLH
jgi:hypothetical protein